MKIIAILIITLGVVVFANYYVVSDKVWNISETVEKGEVFLLADDLSPLGIQVVGNPVKGPVYLFFKDHIVTLRKSGKVTMDFVDTLSERGTLFSGSTVYVSAEVVEKITGYRWRSLPGDSMAIFLKDRSIVSVTSSSRSVFLKFNGPIPNDMIKSSLENGVLHIVTYPIRKVLEVSKKFKWKFEDEKFQMFIKISQYIRPVIHIRNDTVEIRMVPQSTEFFGKMKLSDGVTFKREKVRIDGDSMIVDSVVVDLRRASIVPEVSAAGVGSLETIRSMVDRTGAIAGVNANYFDPRTSLIIGLLIRYGKPLSTAFGGRPIFVITDNDEAMIGKFFVEVHASIGDTPFLVKGIDTISKGDMILFTDDYAKAIPKIENRIYILGKDGRIIGFGYKKFLDDGEYLASIDPRYSKYLKGLKINDTFRIRIESTFDIPIKHAVEAGPLVLLNGKPLIDQTSEKHRYGGGLAFYKATRTLVAIKDSHTVVLMMTEGKVTYDDMVNYLMSKGFVSAMFLDGGSSSTMVVKDMTFTGNGKERYVASGLLVFPKR